MLRVVGVPLVPCDQVPLPTPCKQHALQSDLPLFCFVFYVKHDDTGRKHLKFDSLSASDTLAASYSAEEVWLVGWLDGGF